MNTQCIDNDLYQSIMVEELKDVEPFLDRFELILPDQPIKPFSTFRLVVKASGSDLPTDGGWFQIDMDGQVSPDTTIISQPKGEKLGIGMTGEWQVELQSPEEEGDTYWLHAIMNSVETDQPTYKVPFSVKLNPESSVNRVFLSTVFLGVTALGVFWLALSFKIDSLKETLGQKIDDPIVVSSTALDNILETSINLPTQSGISEESNNLVEEDLKTKKEIDGLIDQSFNNPNVVMRQQAWRELTDYLNLQISENSTFTNEIQQQRLNYKQQTELLLTSNDDPNELLKRLQVLAFIDDDPKAQRWLGNLYASGNIVDEHLGKAWHWYQRAANKGDTEAQQLLDHLEAHADELLSSEKLEQRLQGYQVAEAAASSGAVQAQLWMGYRYEIGDGVDRDLVVSANLYRKAAEQDNIIANEKLPKILELIAKKNIES